MNQEQLQQRYIQLQLLDQHTRQIQQQINILEQQKEEFKVVNESLKDISNTSNNTQLFSPLGLGMFLKTELKDNKEILMNVGSRVIVKKPILEAHRLLEKQTEEINSTLESLKAQLTNNLQLVSSLSSEIETSTSKLKKK